MAKAKLTTYGKIFFGIILLVVLLILFTILPSQNNLPPKQSLTTTMTATTSTVVAPLAGRILVGFIDDFHKVAGIGTVTMLNLNVKEIDVRENNQTEWINIFSGSKTFDAIALSNQTAIVSDSNLLLKNYTQERVILGDSEIKVYNPSINIFNRTYSIYPDSNETIISYSFMPEQNKAAFLVFDLNIENSIVHRLEGYFISPQFTPSFSLLPVGAFPENAILIS
jgi:hypothetical protein